LERAIVTLADGTPDEIKRRLDRYAQSARILKRGRSRFVLKSVKNSVSRAVGC
jgi:hypothetical protein